jgi:hypothetical protein
MRPWKGSSRWLGSNVRSVDPRRSAPQPSNPLMQPTNADGATFRPPKLSDGGLRNVGFLKSFAADLHFVRRTRTSIAGSTSMSDRKLGVRTLCCLTVLLLGLGLPAFGQDSSSSCREFGGGGRVEARLEHLKTLMSSRDTDWVATRVTTKLPRSRASSVHLVERPGVCKRAAEALNQVREEPGRVRELWVYDLGSGYAVDDPGLDIGFADRVLYFFDRNWRYTVTFSGY